VSANPTFNGSYVRLMNENDSPVHWFQLNQVGVPSSYINLNSFSGYEITQLNSKTIYFQGNLENKNFDSGQLSYSTGKSYPGQHLIGNPYTSAIDISKIEFGSQDAGIIENSVYLYNTGSYDDWLAASPSNPSVDENVTPGQYIAIPKNVANRGIGIPNQIPSMQAFIVRVKSSNPSAWVKIPYSSIGTTVKNASLQRLPTVENTSTRIVVKGTKFSDSMWLISEPMCTHGFENGWDGFKFIGATVAPQIYAMESSGNYQVNSVDNIDNTNIGFMTGEDENYTLTFTHQNLAAKYPRLYLQDFQNNTLIDITESGTNYSFSAQKSSVPINRFKIVTNPGISTEETLPSIENIKVYSSNQMVSIDNKTNYSGSMFLYDLSGRLVLHKEFNANAKTSIKTDLFTGFYVSKVIVKDIEIEIKNSLQICNEK
jgi:hypothetical protein